MKARTTRSPHRAAPAIALAIAAGTVAAMAVPASAAAAPAPGATATSGANALALISPVRAALPLASHGGTYQVRAGDTVSHIALRTGTSVQAIIEINGLNRAGLIRVGQVLRLPGASVNTPSQPRPASSSASRTHTVRSGDTVSALAARYGTTVQAIISANNLNSRALIIVGQRLTIPGNGSGSSSSGSSGSSSSGSSSSGSSNSGSSSSGSSSSGSSSSGSSRSATTHTVRSGDTVSALAARYGTTVQAIISANNLNSRALIIVGQRLTIPGNGSGSSSSGSSSGGSGSSSNSSNSGSSSSGSSSSGSTGTSNSAVTHTVRSGDTVSALAARYGTTVQAIISANNLNSRALIIVGQRLTIPATVTPVSNSGGSNDQLVGDTFLGRTYPSSVVAAANQNKATLLSMDVPSRAQMQAMVRSVAVEMGVDPALAQAIAQQESGFDARAVSPANAVGVMQVIPSSGEWASNLVGRQLNLLDPHDNVVAGVAILRQLLRSAPDFDTAVAGYYQGLAGVLRDGMFSDTRNYVAGIHNRMGNFS